MDADKFFEQAASSDSSLSEIVDEAVRLLMLEDQEDLEAIANRVAEPVITYDALLKDLKKNGKL